MRQRHTPTGVAHVCLPRARMPTRRTRGHTGEAKHGRLGARGRGLPVCVCEARARARAQDRPSRLAGRRSAARSVSGRQEGSEPGSGAPFLGVDSARAEPASPVPLGLVPVPARVPCLRRVLKGTPLRVPRGFPSRQVTGAGPSSPQSTTF